MNQFITRLVFLTSLALTLAVAGCGIEGIIDSGIDEAPAISGDSSGGVTLSPYITDGQSDPGHPSVGQLYSGGASCTATLIGSRTVLTAGHCVGSSARFTIGGMKYYSSKVIRHQSYGGGNRNDMAIIILQNKVQGVYPSPIATTPPKEGTSITLVGFGKTGEYAKDYGTKRYTTNTIGKVGSTTFSFYGKKNICNGDSGGPTFAWFGGAEVVIGVHSTKSGWCGNGGTDMRVDSYIQWIKAKAGSDVLLQGQGTQPPPNGKPGEGQDCSKKACDGGHLTCVEIKAGANAMGKFCMEKCNNPGKADPLCDGGEVCTASHVGNICFDAKKPGTGYTNRQPKNTPTPPIPPKPPIGSIKEGKSCDSGGACAAGLTCVSVQSSGKVIGKWCMEKCQTAGASDPTCDGGEVCTYSAAGPVCFDVNGKANGYTNPTGLKMMTFPKGQEPVLPPGYQAPKDPTPPGTPPGTPPSGGSCGDSDESKVFDLLNKERAKRGLGSLSCDLKALTVARGHSEDMCKRGYFSHTNKKGQAPWTRLKLGGVQFSSAGENIAYGYSTPEAVNKGWMNSYGHRKNMLSSGWQRAAIGLYLCNGKTKYWTEVFMR